MSAEAMQSTPRVSRPGTLAERVSLGVFLGIHVASLLAIASGVSWRAVGIAVALFWIRMFFITAGYHRYFSHRAYKTSRFFQFLLGLAGTTCVQKGPLWWASVHRKHHRYSDTAKDVHSPRQRGFWYSHVGWVMSTEHVDTDLRSVKELAKYPELHWLGKYHFVAPVALAFLCWVIGGFSGLVVGFGWSTVALWHATFTINSLAHVFGRPRYRTGEDSKNHLGLALLTMGEGWHNNHHHYMNSANQGFFWWEVDLSYYVLKGLEVCGIVWDLKKVPKYVIGRDLIRRGAGDKGQVQVQVQVRSEAPAVP